MKEVSLKLHLYMTVKDGETFEEAESRLFSTLNNMIESSDGMSDQQYDVDHITHYEYKKGVE